MTRDILGRRAVLKATAAAAVGVSLAGCTTDASTADGGSGSDGSDAGGASADETRADGSGEASADLDGWFDGVSNYDGVHDETGSDEVVVTVGAAGNGASYAFSPAAVRVSAGTTVVWKWSGEGAVHNVVAEDGSFESDLVGEAGHTFSHIFDDTGTIKYACAPHEAMGMKGAVIVE